VRPARDAWWDDAVVYQVYPRSFQDADGDGEGDLRGITARLAHIAALGADAVWLSPIYRSPMADGGYDVADYTAVDPRFGTVEDVDALVAQAHRLGLKVLLDAVPCHTSIEHPWFREHPDRYVWSDRDGPHNNWASAFGGSAWSPDPHGRGWYLHSFYPEQPDLDWRNPEVPRAFGAALRFWRDRGIDGFRLDALDRVAKDPDLRDDPRRAPGDAAVLPEGNPAFAVLDPRHSRDAPDIGGALSELRGAVGEAFLVGEVYLPTDRLGPYLEHVDVCFSFELLHASWDAASVRRALEKAAAVGDRRTAWVMSNHDFPRLPSRVGPDQVRAATMLLLTLPGCAFVFQGDEIGMDNGPGRALGDPPDDRHGRDRFRHPMQWDASEHGGFTTGRPWLPVADPAQRNVADQERDAGSLLHLHRDLVGLRRRLGNGLELLDDVADGVLAYRRGEHVVALNLTGVQRPAPASAGAVVARHTHDPRLRAVPRTLGPGEGVVTAPA
jgi:alpha-glucosidase